MFAEMCARLGDVFSAAAAEQTFAAMVSAYPGITVGYAKRLRDYRAAEPNIVVRDLNLGLLPGGAVTVNAVDVCGIDGLALRTGRSFAELVRELQRLTLLCRAAIEAHG